jgi:hypothetical protein
MKIAIIGKGKTCTKVISNTSHEYTHKYFLNEAYKLSNFFKDENCSMFVIDIEPVLNILDENYKIKNLIIPNNPHVNCSPSLFSYSDLIPKNKLINKIESYDLLLSSDVTDGKIQAINSSSQACLSYAILTHKKLEQVDFYGLGGQTHDFFNGYKKIDNRMDYSDQFELLGKLANHYKIQIKIKFH